MKRFLSLFAVLLTVAVDVRATSYVRMSDEALVDEATLVVRARVVRAVEVAPAARPRSGWELEVLETLKGAAPARLVVTVPGGRHPSGRSLRIFGAPRFRAGEQVLLFLHPRRDGTYDVAQLFLGAFHEVQADGRQLAVRNLREVREVVLDGGSGSPEPLRDAEAFAAWVGARAAGRARAADYLFEGDEGGRLRSRVDPFTLFEDIDDGLNLRWFEFDGGGSVPWRITANGQPGLPTAVNDFKAALAAWNNDAATPIQYNYAGTTGSDGGLICPNGECFDDKNTLSLEDPVGDIAGSFPCSGGGVLAIGGPWYGFDIEEFKGEEYHVIVGADILTQNGLKCFYDASPNKSKAAQELFGHELGHTLGLGHSCGDNDGPDPGCNNALFEDALMNAFVHDDGRGARLNSDDKAAIALLYSAAAPPAAPSNLVAEAVTHTAAKVGWTDNSTGETGFRVEVDTGSGFVEAAAVGANITAAILNGLPAGASVSVRVRAQGGGGFSGYSNTAPLVMPASTAVCAADADTLCVLAGRFEVEMIWRAPPGFPNPQAASVAPAGTAASGIFFFDNAADWQVLIKVLNGCSINQRYWVFYAATTNVEFTITVIDTQSGRVKTYANPFNTAAPPVQDAAAFASCP